VPLEPDAEQAPPADQPRRPAPTSVLPDPVRWAGQFVQAATEVCAGLRPVVQLVRWTSEEVYTTMTRRHEMSARALRAGRVTVPGGRLRVRSVRACVVRDGIVEAAAVVFDGVRARAVAVRLEGFDGRWRVTAFELG